YLNSRFLLCKHLVQSVCPPKPNFFNKAKCYRSPPFWRHRDLIPLTQDLRKDEQSNYETDDELIAVHQKYEEDENDTIDNAPKEYCESCEIINNRVTKKIQEWTNLLKSQEQSKDI
ncbi:22256_t:CDS:2, partial [Gigaspora margarita]